MKKSIIITASIILLCSLFGKSSLSLVLTAALCIHEFGHLVALKLLGGRLLSVSPSVLGFTIRYDKLSVSPLKESLICFCGSLFGILSAVAVIMLDLAKYPVAINYVLVSLTLSVMNLLPIQCLDGGEILKCTLESIMLPDTAYKICKAVSGCTAILFWVVSVRIQLRHGINLSMLIMSVYFIYRSIFA